ncbi:PAAR domain-containing protein [Pseudoxanthomonas putridarboris]|uniref:PAAR domain-containing protein n=1 Tax=Pseudoxanthomonas putridarboris TaxID=752605 RepID=A0ABU9J6K6_9GAMM
MKRGYIRLGDPTTGGGIVVSAGGYPVNGKPLALVSDEATCPKHKGSFKIQDGDPERTHEGRSMAWQGSRLACGCQLISTCADYFAYVGPAPSQAHESNALAMMLGEIAPGAASDEQLRFVSAANGAPLAQTRYELALGDGRIVTGITDDDGNTQRVVTVTPTPITQATFHPPEPPQLCCARTLDDDGEKAIAVRLDSISTHIAGLGISQAIVRMEDRGRALTEGEIAMASDVFKDAVDYSKVKVHGTPYLPFGAQPDNTAMTPNGEMYFNPDWFKDDFSVQRPAQKHWFIHEMVHVW